MNTQLSSLKVYYGWCVLNKIRKQPALSVIFENSSDWTGRNLNSVKRLQHTCFERFQTKDEAEDGNSCNRTLTEHTLFLFKKPFFGSIDYILKVNRQADSNNVSEQILDEIEAALIKGYKHLIKSKP